MLDHPLPTVRNSVKNVFEKKFYAIDTIYLPTDSYSSSIFKIYHLLLYK